MKNLPRAQEPFRFFSRLSLTVMTGIKAASAAELLEGIRICPAACLHAHTHHFLRENRMGTPSAANDFALWASEVLQDDELAERLMALEIAECRSVEGIRAALLGALRAHLADHAESSSRRAPLGREFHFLRSVRFSLPTGRTAFDLLEFYSGLKEASLSSFYLHLFESKLRQPAGLNDFSAWLERELAEPSLARHIARFEPSQDGLDDIRIKILELVSARVEEIRGS